MSKEETIKINKNTLQTLLDNFYSVCSLCDEMDIYENEELDNAMLKRKEWANDIFGREIENTTYGYKDE